MSERRSARTNKGQHSQRDLEEDSLYYHSNTGKREFEDAADIDAKKQKLSQTGQENEQLGEEEEGEVLCNPCGANKENYNEETDQGGVMIECDNCKTWQHAKCMGYKTKKAIPKLYNCNLCEPRDIPKVEEKLKGEEANPTITATTAATSSTAPASNGAAVVIPPAAFYPTIPTYSLDNLKDKIRKSVAKAFLNVFQKNVPSDSEDQELATKMALELESEINLFLPRHGQEKKYTDRSRSLMALIKRPSVMSRILLKELSFKDIVNLSPEEIDEELKKYAEKVRSESIRRLVLTVDDVNSQRIRRTHKGDEIVESVEDGRDSSSRNEEMIISKNIDHRRFEEKEPARETRETDGVNRQQQQQQQQQQQLVNNILDDDGDNYRTDDKESEKDGDDIPELDDDDLDFILKDKKVDQEKKTVSSIPTSTVNLPTKPSPSPSSFWNGRITFPDFVTFLAKASFVSCITSSSSNSTSPSAHQKQLKIIKEVLSKPAYEIEGKLDKSRADQYLGKIVSTRDLFIVRLLCGDSDDADKFKKLQDYLFENNKVGVLSGKPHFVKDSYIFSLKSGNIPEYLKQQEFDEQGLFAVFVVKKDYIPSNKSILKKASPSIGNSAQSYTTPKVDTTSLDSILSKLDADDGYVPSLEGRYAVESHISTNHNHNLNQNTHNNGIASSNGNIASSLTTEQLQFLSGIVQQNPHVQNNPDQLLQLLQGQKQ